MLIIKLAYAVIIFIAVPIGCNHVDSSAYATTCIYSEKPIKIQELSRSEERLFSFPIASELESSGNGGNLDAQHFIEIPEHPDFPHLLSGNLFLDASFALDIQEVLLNSVDSIHDQAFNNGKSIPCTCFKTGEKWPYVWTRDIAYSLDLGLSIINWERSKESLFFKVSQFRDFYVKKKYGETVVQDTGTGGSWPISTDRVVWFLGAVKLLNTTSDLKKREILTRAFIGIGENTLVMDRESIFSKKFGLYKGETSFLDWREQTYPSWVTQDIEFIGQSFSLSTNILHYVALKTIAQLIEQQDGKTHNNIYNIWADQLREKIRRYFFSSDKRNMFFVLFANKDALLPLKSYDLLGLSLAIQHGVVSIEEGKNIISNYPMGIHGPTIVWPQRKGVPIYHNRAIWPFVTSYAYKAADHVGHSQFAAKCFQSLVDGISTAFSNMENYEYSTLSTFYNDGALSGPVVNSKHQLWSVAGFFSVLVENIFGVHFAKDGLKIEPKIPAAIIKVLFGSEKKILLSNLRLLERNVSITLLLPEDLDSLDDNTWLRAEAYSLNGVKITSPFFDWATIPPDMTTISLEFYLKLDIGAPPLSLTTHDQFSQHFAPKEPLVEISTIDKRTIQFLVDKNGESDTVLSLYRNGKLVATTMENSFVIEKRGGDILDCFFVEQYSPSAGFSSFPSKPKCIGKSEFIGVRDLTFYGKPEPKFSEEHCKIHIADWGRQEQHINYVFTPEKDGVYRLEVEYGNHFGPISTGITTGVKKITFTTAGIKSDAEVLTLPHRQSWGDWGVSNYVRFSANRKIPIRLDISDHYNMSYLQHYAVYTGGIGGNTGETNRFNISGLWITYEGPLK